MIPCISRVDRQRSGTIFLKVRVDEHPILQNHVSCTTHNQWSKAAIIKSGDRERSRIGVNTTTHSVCLEGSRERVGATDVLDRSVIVGSGSAVKEAVSEGDIPLKLKCAVGVDSHSGTAKCSTILGIQGTRTDGGAAGIAVGAGEHQGAHAHFGKGSRIGHCP